MSKYLSLQPDLSADMREIVIDWLIDVHRKFKMRQETFFMTGSLLNRYLERCMIKKEIF